MLGGFKCSLAHSRHLSILTNEMCDQMRTLRGTEEKELQYMSLCICPNTVNPNVNLDFDNNVQVWFNN